MEDKFTQQIKKGVLELLVLKLICDQPSYGYQLQKQLSQLSDGLFQLKEGVLYPILYRLEDDGLIVSGWQQGQGRAAPKKIYRATPLGHQENSRRQEIWQTFTDRVQKILKG